jgi:hypothetical protein
MKEQPYDKIACACTGALSAQLDGQPLLAPTNCWPHAAIFGELGGASLHSSFATAAAYAGERAQEGGHPNSLPTSARLEVGSLHPHVWLQNWRARMPATESSKQYFLTLAHTGATHSPSNQKDLFWSGHLPDVVAVASLIAPCPASRYQSSPIGSCAGEGRREGELRRAKGSREGRAGIRALPTKAQNTGLPRRT